MKQLNTMDTFLNGFKIERNGEVFTLTPEEMSDFRYLEKAIDGRSCLECYNVYGDELDSEIIKKMMEDEEICFNIEDDILDILFKDAGGTEREVIERYITRNSNKMRTVWFRVGVEAEVTNDELNVLYSKDRGKAYELMINIIDNRIKPAGLGYMPAYNNGCEDYDNTNYDIDFCFKDIDDENEKSFKDKNTIKIWFAVGMEAKITVEEFDDFGALLVEDLIKERTELSGETFIPCQSCLRGRVDNPERYRNPDKEITFLF